MSSQTVVCGKCNTTLGVPPGHQGLLTCGNCQTTLQVSANNPPAYNAAPAPAAAGPSTVVVTTTGGGGCANCGGALGPPQWTATAWLLCLCFFPWNFCIPGCQPSEQRCTRCGHVKFVDM
ncbi:uncharacterized protein LOC135826305 [Sycon ciliatum]|uniref:uncharacterized protein LOC135826305 n=1 Tax=Sycon ciliatum TaxID=27933 RepID=UPI0031F672D0|eukprot:scpid90698/ scgid9280/ 